MPCATCPPANPSCMAPYLAPWRGCEMQPAKSMIWQQFSLPQGTEAYRHPDFAPRGHTSFPGFGGELAISLTECSCNEGKTARTAVLETSRHGCRWFRPDRIKSFAHSVSEIQFVDKTGKEVCPLGAKSGCRYASAPCGRLNCYIFDLQLQYCCIS